MGQPRGQSSVISVVLLIAIVMTAIAITVGVGALGLSESQESADIGRIEQSLTQFDSQVSLVALGAQQSQSISVDLGSGGSSMRVEGDAGWMNVTIFNETDGAVEAVVLNESLGAVVYEQNDNVVAYQGGGVWRRGETGGSSMVSPPEFHYRVRSGERPTLTLPLIVVQPEDRRVSRNIYIRENGTAAKYPVPGSSDRTNPLQGGDIVIRVQSEYYRAWGQFFEDRTGGDVAYDHDRQVAEITLVVPSGGGDVVEGGLVTGGSAGDELVIPQSVEADSYNSSAGSYSSSSAENTTIVAARDVTIENQGRILGDLKAGGTVTFEHQNAEVTGNVSYGATLNQVDPNNIGGWSRNDADVTVPDPVDSLINDRRTEFNGSNDNSAADDIDDGNDELQGCGGTCELTDGSYILDEISFGSGDELVLNTTDGEVQVAVRNGVSLNGGKIRVTGGGTARLYLEGSLTVASGANVSVPDERSPGLWFYMNPGSEAEITQGGTRFVGVVYGPGSGSQSGVKFDITQQADVFGGVVGKSNNIGQNIGLHFDEALRTEDPLDGAGGAAITRISYLHVTVNRVNVSG